MAPLDAAPTWTAAEVDRLSAAALAGKLFGPDAAGLVEVRRTRIPGVARWAGINVEFAGTPRPSGRAGLCSFDLASAYFEWPGNDRADDAPITLSRTSRRTGFALTSARASLSRQNESEDACRSLAPMLAEPPKEVAVERDGKAGTVDDAAFAFAALIRAREARLPLRCDRSEGARCTGQFTRWASLDPRAAYRLQLIRCGVDLAWCIDASFDRPTRGGAVILRLVTTATTIVTEKAGIRSATLSVITWPIA